MMMMMMMIESIMLFNEEFFGAINIENIVTNQDVTNTNEAFQFPHNGN
jgi:hypothetical protein